jgi:uncharacterized membrane protein YcaP (DUF421 family)
VPDYHLSWTSFVNIVITGVVVYAGVILATRLHGLRSFAKMSSFDFAMTVAVGSLMATAVVSREPMLLPGLMGIVMFYVLQALVGKLRVRSKAVERLVDNEPVLLMDGSRVLQENLAQAGVTRDDLRAKLREANVLNYTQVRAVVLETTGSISVLHSSDEEEYFDPDLIKAVRR